jgi:hypothetical protein
MALPPQVSDATGQMNLTKVADSSPFASDLLIPDDCFVLDNGLCGKIYIWKGTCGSSAPPRPQQANHCRAQPGTQFPLCHFHRFFFFF